MSLTPPPSLPPFILAPPPINYPAPLRPPQPASYTIAVKIHITSYNPTNPLPSSGSRTMLRRDEEGIYIFVHEPMDREGEGGRRLLEVPGDVVAGGFRWFVWWLSKELSCFGGRTEVGRVFGELGDVVFEEKDGVIKPVNAVLSLGFKELVIIWEIPVGHTGFCTAPRTQQALRDVLEVLSLRVRAGWDDFLQLQLKISSAQ